MDNVYTCICGNQVWTIADTGVRCTACAREFAVEHQPAADFNRAVLQEMEELEQV